MQITLDIPEEFAAQIIPPGKDPARTALEALALDGYRNLLLSEEDVRRMLGYESRFQVHALLKEHDVYLNYSMADLEQDIKTVDAFHARRTSKELQRAGSSS